MSWGADDVLALFIEFGGDLSIRDNAGMLAEDYADDEIKEYIKNASE
jgi:hypothetical protein